jgi:hypothetical protein
MGRRLGLWVSISTQHGHRDLSLVVSYRNFMMLSAALVDQRVKPVYSTLLSNPIPPGVDNLKVWIEEAWKRGGYLL